MSCIRLCMIGTCAVALVSSPICAEPLRDTIDRRVQAAWKSRSIEPAVAASDAEFLRRVFLDLIGTIPTAQEAEAFLRDTQANKRATLIDRLLDDPRYAEHQGEVWDMILFGRRPPGYGTDKRGAFQAWMKEQFTKNTPYDQWVRTILRAEGNTVEHGPPMYFVQYKDRPEDVTEAITQTFLGVQLQCARCHDHPFEPWTQVDFYGTAAFFARLRVVDVGKQDKLTMYAIGEKNTGEVLFTGPVTKQEVGQKGQPVKPKFLQAEPLLEPELPADFKEDRNFAKGKQPPAPKFSRKNALAERITRADNPYFSRAVTNRLWAQFMGRGLVHPVDNMSPSNEPSHPELLTELTAAMVEHKFDLKWYIRELVSSRTYQLSGSGPVAAAMPQWFERARTRPLSAEEMLDSWKVAVRWDAAEKTSGKQPSADRYAPLGSGFLLKFLGRPNNGVGDFQGGLQEHLYFNNGGIAKLMTRSKDSLYDSLLKSEAPPEKRVDQLFLSTLSRFPIEEERTHFLSYLAADAKPDDRLKEAIWVLMTCSEFRFNH